jgi:hypothetical protein
VAYCDLSGTGYGNQIVLFNLLITKLIVAFMDVAAEKLIIFIAAYMEVTVKKLMTKNQK